MNINSKHFGVSQPKTYKFKEYYLGSSMPENCTERKYDKSTAVEARAPKEPPNYDCGGEYQKNGLAGLLGWCVIKEDSYGRGVGYIPSNTCDYPGSCGGHKIGGLGSATSCDNGPRWDFWNLKTCPAKIICNDGDELTNGICYPKCRPGYSPFGNNLCRKDNVGAMYKPDYYCPEGQELLGGLCYDKCPYDYSCEGLNKYKLDYLKCDKGKIPTDKIYCCPNTSTTDPRVKFSNTSSTTGISSDVELFANGNLVLSKSTYNPGESSQWITVPSGSNFKCKMPSKTEVEINDLEKGKNYMCQDPGGAGTKLKIVETD